MGIPSQIFINDDCTESFYCLDDPDAGTDGCFIECTDNQVQGCTIRLLPGCVK